VRIYIKRGTLAVRGPSIAPWDISALTAIQEGFDLLVTHRLPPIEIDSTHPTFQRSGFFRFAFIVRTMSTTGVRCR
jgi:hypothetical protein